MLRPILRPLLLVALAGTVGACDSTDSGAQALFEAQALALPSGYTRTNATGDVLSTDADDWRIGPGYATRVIAVDPLFPNPIRAEDYAALPVNTSGTSGGLVLAVLQSDGRLRTLDTDEGATQPGLPTLGFFGSELGVVGGLYRVLLLDGVGGVVSYGDVQYTPR